MRKWVLGVWLAGVSLLGVGVASAAAPAPGRSFGGSGPDYLNRTSSWRGDGRGSFSFRTSTDGSRLLGFRGSYTYYCGRGGRTAVHANYLAVGRGGSFEYPFRVRVASGIIYVKIYGSFLRGGTTAQVLYLVDFVAKGQKVRHPYDTRHPSKLGCASWVRGTARAS